MIICNHYGTYSGIYMHIYMSICNYHYVLNVCPTAQSLKAFCNILCFKHWLQLNEKKKKKGCLIGLFFLSAKSTCRYYLSDMRSFQKVVNEFLTRYRNTDNKNQIVWVIVVRRGAVWIYWRTNRGNQRSNIQKMRAISKIKRKIL